MDLGLESVVPRQVEMKLKTDLDFSICVFNLHFSSVLQGAR